MFLLKYGRILKPTPSLLSSWSRSRKQFFAKDSKTPPIDSAPSTSSESLGNFIDSDVAKHRYDPSKAIKVRVQNGLPELKIPLPSRDEKCLFILLPNSDTVGSFCDKLKDEDKGIEIASVYGVDGTRVSRSVQIQNLMLQSQFRLRINDEIFDVETPNLNPLLSLDALKSTDTLKGVSDLKALVATLYAVLNVDGFKLDREKVLMKELEQVELELRPMEQVRRVIDTECDRYSVNVLWAGLVAMGIQTGVFLRLTFVDYSWDIVEPCTYFATFSTVMATFGYYIHTKQNFEYTSAHERLFTSQFHKRAKKYKFDIRKYNDLKQLQHDLKQDLRRLRDPLQQHLPAHRLAALESEAAKTRLTGLNKTKPKA